MGSMYPQRDRCPSKEPATVPLSVLLQPFPSVARSNANQTVQSLFQPSEMISVCVRWLSSVGIVTVVLLGVMGVKATAQAALPGDRQQMVAQASTAPASQQLLFVHPSIGNDDGNGSQGSPLRTISRALELSQPNTVIILAVGTYSADTGESFPLRLKPGVTLQGDPATQGRGIVIRGGGLFPSPTSANQNVAIVGANESVITGVTVTNSNPRGYGLWIESSSPTVISNTFSGSTHDGISITGSSAPVIQTNLFSQNGANGITVFGTSQAEIRENVFERTGFGINVAQNAAPQIVDNRISQNQDGVVVQANSRPVLRNNTIEGNVRDGLVAIAQSQPDLGTATQAGNNIFRNNGRHDINAEASRQRFPAAGNQVAAERIVGQVDMAGTVAVTPAPVATRPVLPSTTPSTTSSTNPSAIATRPSTPTVAAPIATSPPQGNLNATEERNSTTVTPPASSAPSADSRSTTSGFSSLPRLQSSASVSLPSPSLPQQTVAPTDTTGADSRSSSDGSFPTPTAPSATATRPNLAPRTTLPLSRASAVTAPSAAIDIPVPLPASTPQSRPPSSSTAQSNSGRSATASAPIEISVPPPATTAAQPSASRPDARDILVQRQSQPSSARSTPTPASPMASSAIEIPVPPPVNQSTPVPAPSSSQSLARATEAPSPSPQTNLLPVPGSEIPVGNIAGMPTVAVSRDPLQRVASNSAPVPSQAAALGLRYRVVIEAEDEGLQAQVRSLIPGAFRTYANGRIVMQAGAYSDRANAEDAARLLNNSGLRAIVQSVE